MDFLFLRHMFSSSLFDISPMVRGVSAEMRREGLQYG
jgi:hypothetical protein